MVTKTAEKKNKLTTTVFLPPPVNEDLWKRAALLSVRDQIPIECAITYTLDKVSDRKDVEGVTGREYTATLTFTPAPDAPRVEQVLASLEPQVFNPDNPVPDAS